MLFASFLDPAIVALAARKACIRASLFLTIFIEIPLIGTDVHPHGQETSGALREGGVVIEVVIGVVH